MTTNDNSDQGDRLRDLLAKCIEVLETDGKSAVEKICAENPDLADQIRRRLAGLGELGILQPPDELAVLSAQLGAFELIEKLGRGGMGSVYLAMQQEPVKRQVALKVINPGMDSRELLARFAAERQALALMNHPGIANVFDAGVTTKERPFFVMEYVPGIPLTEYCNIHRLDLLTRLVFFVDICGAVQHAHQKGIIHRDLKPSNILVMEQGGKALAKIIDFGVAKAMDESLATGTLHTEMGSILGTPEYMSPEQAGNQAFDIDTRTDVYSLGVILYELLTGTLPFPSNRLRHGSQAEMQRIICEEDPPSPSRRVSTVAKDPETGKDFGGGERKNLARWLKGDPSWITMRALEKDRERRYQTAQELAADIERYLNHEPVLATPPSITYRSGKFLRRYRLQAISGALVLLSLVIGLIVSLNLYFIAHTNAITAERTSDFLVDMFEHASPDKSLGEEIPVSLLLQQGVERIKSELVGQPLVRARLLANFGDIYAWLDQQEKSLDLLSEAIRIKTELSGPADEKTLLWRLGRVNPLLSLEKISAAAEEMDRIERIVLREFGEEHVLMAICLGHRGNVLKHQGRYKEAGKKFWQALDSARSNPQVDPMVLSRLIKYLANFLHENERHREALVFIEEALQISASLFPKGHPDTITLLKVKSGCLTVLGKYVEAEKAIKKAMADGVRYYGENHLLAPAVLNTYAKLLAATDRIGQAIEFTRRAISGEEKKADPDQQSLALYRNNLGIRLLRTGEYSAAISSFEQAVQDYKDIHGGDNLHLAMCQTNLAEALRKNGKPTPGEKIARQALAMHHRLGSIAGAPLFESYLVLAHTLVDTGRLDQAEKVLLEGIGKGGGGPGLGSILSLLALVNNQRGRGVEAEKYACLAVVEFKKVFPADHHHIALALHNRGWALHQQKKNAAAETILVEAIEMFRRVCPGGHPDAAYPLNYLGWILTPDRTKDAVPYLQEALDIRQRLLPPGAYWRLVSMNNLLSAYSKLNNHQAAQPLLLEMFQQLKKTRGLSHRATISTLKGLISNCEHLGKKAEAARYRGMLPGDGAK